MPVIYNPLRFKIDGSKIVYTYKSRTWCYSCIKQELVAEGYTEDLAKRLLRQAEVQYFKKEVK